jgi:hypothetical protein
MVTAGVPFVGWSWVAIGMALSSLCGVVSVSELGHALLGLLR